MIRKFLASILLIILCSCSKQFTTNFGIEKSNINNLSFKDINKIKEYKSCSEIEGKDISPYFIKLLFWPLFFISPTTSDQYHSEGYVLKSGDSSISTAVKMGGISTIKMVDYSYEITGIFGREFCVIVYGE